MSIRKVRGKKLWKVYSEKHHKLMGTFSSKGLAEKRLKQVEFFKRKKR